MSCKLEPAIWSRCTGQRIACFDRCQFVIAGISNIKEVRGKLRLYVSFLEYGRHVGQLRRRRRAYAPTSNTASQDNHEKISSWVSFSFPCMLSMGLRLAALRAAGAPLKLFTIKKTMKPKPNKNLRSPWTPRRESELKPSNYLAKKKKL